MADCDNLTCAYLRSILDYDSEAGVFRWKVKKGERGVIGSIAGTLNRGYVRIAIDRRIYAAHRLAWLWVTGEWPSDQLDHIDMCKSNNRWANLRSASNSQNRINSGVQKNNKSGFRGVFWNKKLQCWRVQISKDSKKRHVGSFATLSEAGKAYCSAVIELHGEYARPESYSKQSA